MPETGEYSLESFKLLQLLFALLLFHSNWNGLHIIAGRNASLPCRMVSPVILVLHFMQIGIGNIECQLIVGGFQSRRSILPLKPLSLIPGHDLMVPLTINPRFIVFGFCRTAEDKMLFPLERVITIKVTGIFRIRV